MLQKETNYEFRKRMMQVHKKDIRDDLLVAEESECELAEGAVIYVAKDAGDVILTAAMDFVDYLFTSMGVSAMLKKGKPENPANSVSIALAQDEGVDLGEYAGYRGYRIDTAGGIRIYANDERGAAQALYYLEFLMDLRKAPFIAKGTISRKPCFSPMMVHSGYAIDEYPNEHLNAIAHEGRDAILVFTRGVNMTSQGFLDFNTLIYRAAKYGLDVYAYSYMPSKIHPEDEGAQSYYESTYGTLFKTCPGLKGVVLVGESVHFPSKDPNVAKEAVSPDGIPSVKYTSFYYPCMDYVQLVGIIRDTCRKYNPEADIVFWTYNFCRMPADIRVRLLNELPTDISLQATFEMGERYALNGIVEYTADYTLAFEGYGQYFKSEAEVAKRRGIRLYSMTNTGGLTWDMGTIPYQPMPYQWLKRYRKMMEAREKWGLSGIMESHHYGFCPSFITKLSNLCFTKSNETMEECLAKVLCAEFGRENQEAVDSALKLWSDAATYYTPTGEDQYGAFRVGPSYPFCLERLIKLPTAPHALMKGICIPEYCEEFGGRATLISERVWKEIECLIRMKELIDRGIEILTGIENKNDSLLYLLNLGNFMSHYIQTGIHAKKWHTLKCRFDYMQDRQESARILDEMEGLLLAEKENAKETIPYVELDSRLGWEPSMEYMCDREHIEWKLRQVDYVLQYEIANYRKSIALKEEDYECHCADPACFAVLREDK